MHSDLVSDDHKYPGFYRALVIEVDMELKSEKNAYGAIKVYIPAVMKDHFDVREESDSSKLDMSKLKGSVAFPANNPIGGYNTHDTEAKSHFLSSCYVPAKGSWVWVFFEGGDINRPFYTGAFNYQNAMVPAENRKVETPHRVYTVIKTGEGRSIVVCDSPDRARVQITGKKRLMNEGPAGDDNSVYTIDGNQTTILLSEQVGKEQLLIKTHKGDYINIDIEKQTLEMYFKGGINIKTDGALTMESAQATEMKSGAAGTTLQTAGSSTVKSGMNTYVSAGLSCDMKSGVSNKVDSGMTLVQSGKACPGKDAKPTPPNSGNEGKTA